MCDQSVCESNDVVESEGSMYKRGLLLRSNALYRTDRQKPQFTAVDGEEKEHDKYFETSGQTGLSCQNLTDDSNSFAVGTNINESLSCVKASTTLENFASLANGDESASQKFQEMEKNISAQRHENDSSFSKNSNSASNTTSQKKLTEDGSYSVQYEKPPNSSTRNKNNPNSKGGNL